MCSQHVLDNSHSFGQLEDVMYIILIRKTRRHLNTIERFYVYQETKNENKLSKIFRQYKKIVLRLSESTYNKPPDYNNKEESTQKGLRLLRTICFFDKNL